MYCPNCGKFNKDDAKVCSGCKKPLVPHAKKPNILLRFLIVLIILFIIAYLIYGNKVFEVILSFLSEVLKFIS